MDVDVYMSSYQEQMLRLALERHFETERENFCNRTFKIKTLALFFIDDISSLYYRVVVLVPLFRSVCYTVRDAVDWFFPPTARRFTIGSNHSPLQYC